MHYDLQRGICHDYTTYSLWAWYPNPFNNYNDTVKKKDDLLLVDGSLTGETDPIRPLIVPERQVDFVIVYEAGTDSEYSWNTGDALINSAQSAQQGGIPFPEIPSVQTLRNRNLTRYPTFFGCSASAETPLVLWLPNSPWSGYSNYSYRTSSFSRPQLDDAAANAFNIATYGNGTIDVDWAACLACAAVYKSLGRVGIDVPEQCDGCFRRHCWNGTEDDARLGKDAYDYRPILNQSYTYEVWNRTWSSSAPGGRGPSTGDGTAGGPGGSGGDAGSSDNTTGSSRSTDSVVVAQSPTGTVLVLTALGCVLGVFLVL